MCSRSKGFISYSQRNTKINTPQLSSAHTRGGKFKTHNNASPRPKGAGLVSDPEGVLNARRACPLNRASQKPNMTARSINISGLEETLIVRQDLISNHYLICLQIHNTQHPKDHGITMVFHPDIFHTTISGAKLILCYQFCLNVIV